MRYILLLCVTLILVSCQNYTITLSGKVEGIKEPTEMYLHLINDNNQPEIIDTIVVENEKFSYNHTRTDKPQIAYFSINNAVGNVIFFPENKNITFTIYKDSLYSSKVKGGKTNSLFAEYNKEIKDFAFKKRENMEALQEARRNMDNDAFVALQTENVVIADEEKVYKKEFAKKNINTILGLILVQEMLSLREMTAREAKSALEKVDPKLKETHFYIGIEKIVEANKSIDIGDIAPNFSAPTPEGDMLSLNEVLGKVTLIDFWASWCRPCREENPNVVRVHNQYKDKGLNIISVSLDQNGQKGRWLKAIEDDQMDWYHISNLQHWNDPIAREYGVRSIPATFLLDENGKVIAKNLRGAALGKKIGELLD
jgi:thiol-disulfide isomerase/thioredoxin